MDGTVFDPTEGILLFRPRDSEFLWTDHIIRIEVEHRKLRNSASPYSLLCSVVDGLGITGVGKMKQVKKMNRCDLYII
jgi:hypothetical protein